MQTYKDLVSNILTHGTQREDRTGKGTISLFGPQMEFDLKDGFPLVTVKRTPFRSILSELLWFIEGSSDERRLAEILHGDRSNEKKTIWYDNAHADYWKDKAQYHGHLGRIYGVQWRSWRGHNGESYDQLASVIDKIKHNPTDRRIILTAWNPGELHEMALPPCHAFAQFYVRGQYLDCKMYQRSADVFLGVPFNIASYSLLLMMVAQVCDLKPGRLIHTLGDSHIYLDHIEQCKKMLEKECLPLPTVTLNPSIKDIDLFTMDDFTLHNYQSHEPLYGEMAV